MTQETTSRADHLAWCKKRAMEYVEQGDTQQAFSSMASDLSKHSETEGHIGVQLGVAMLLSGHLNSVPEMTKWIQGFN